MRSEGALGGMEGPEPRFISDPRALVGGHVGRAL
jgi:hypothetical protein